LLTPLWWCAANATRAMPWSQANSIANHGELSGDALSNTQLELEAMEARAAGYVHAPSCAAWTLHPSPTLCVQPAARRRSTLL